VPELEAEGFGSGGIVQNRLMCEGRVADERIGRWKPPGRCCERSEADFAASAEAKCRRAFQSTEHSKKHNVYLMLYASIQHFLPACI